MGIRGGEAVAAARPVRTLADVLDELFDAEGRGDLRSVVFDASDRPGCVLVRRVDRAGGERVETARFASRRGAHGMMRALA